MTRSLLSIFLLLGVSTTSRTLATSVIDDQKLMDQFFSKDGGDIPVRHQRDLNVNGGLALDRCGNRSPCAEGFECISLGIGRSRRCFPRECLAEEMGKLMLEFDAQSFMSEIYERANVTEDQLAAARDANPNAILWTPQFRSFNDAVRSLAGPREQIQSILRYCNAPAAQRRSFEPRNTTNLDGFSYYGTHVEVGVMLEYSETQLTTDISGDDRSYTRTCLGGGPVFLAQAAYVVGVVTNGNDADDLTCGSIWADADLAAVLGVGIAGGLGINGAVMYEVSIGIGVGGGGTVSLCRGVESTQNDDGN